MRNTGAHWPPASSVHHVTADNIALRTGFVLLIGGVLLAAIVGTIGLVMAVVGLGLLALSQSF